METSIDYYFSVASPWSYLGSERFIGIARRYDVPVKVIPLDLTRVFAASGGLPYEKRSAQRRSYRQVELDRWSRKLGVPVTLEPRYYPVDRRPASYLLIAARRERGDVLNLSHAILRAIWHEERNLADWSTLTDIADQEGLNGRALVRAAQDISVAREHERDTDHAIAAQVFGAPTYIIDGELFWGQDRLGFLE
ncbi:2-hydroxychromene-2-carboxylate isomerase, partial [Microvirga massiliensis]|uniref:2-hydroxychromene-2-carboxylate isomerase n=1 Tax=Microvirga massiliensis TaxID=1033741 RepID=UPI00062B993C